MTLSTASSKYDVVVVIVIVFAANKFLLNIRLIILPTFLLVFAYILLYG